MAAGGITTLVWDFRQRLLALFVRRHPAHKQDQEHAVSENARTDSPPVQSRDAEDIELHELPAVPSTPRRDDGSVKSLVRSPADAPAGEVDITGAPPSPRRTPSPPPSSLPSGIRQRPSATAAPVEPSTTNNDDEAQQAPERTATQLMTLGFKPALAMAGTFIAVVVVFVVVRASLTQVGRAFDVSEIWTTFDLLVHALPKNVILIPFGTSCSVLCQHDHRGHDHLWRWSGRHSALARLHGRQR